MVSNLKRVVMFQSCVAQMSLDPLGIHGPVHWFKVYRNCQNLDELIYKNTDEVRDWFYWCFAMMHDCCRVDDHGDVEHPFAAAKLVPQDGSNFNERLHTAVKNHSTGKTTEDDLIAICWDADRLELTRVGIIPDPKMMSTQPGREMAKALGMPPRGYDHKSDWPGGPK